MKTVSPQNPNAKLFYNDYNDETMNVKSDAIYAMAADFKNRGVIDGRAPFQVRAASVETGRRFSVLDDEAGQSGYVVRLHLALHQCLNFASGAASRQQQE